MSSFAWSDSVSEHPPVAVLLPGGRYPVEGPLLYWCAEMLAESGWHVEAVRWDTTEQEPEDPVSFVESAVAAAFAAAPSASRRLIVAKSFGSFALPWAARNGVPGIWLTPILTSDAVRAGLLAATAADVAIGGDADDLWPNEVADSTARLITVSGANHALELAGDWRSSVSLQADLFDQVAEHIQRLEVLSYTAR
ncbi:hypothetical protein [Salinibacterium sp. ZJ450]|uniref:hypothetical protein n=1 Tax=Salinibacterium sp. ZJ450 TaxID=2708338 RepID=UPI0014207A8C|nr:hypothetical protein [Salinibacterium sp. ZJ450]